MALISPESITHNHMSVIIQKQKVSPAHVLHETKQQGGKGQRNVRSRYDVVQLQHCYMELVIISDFDIIW